MTLTAAPRARQRRSRRFSRAFSTGAVVAYFLVLLVALAVPQLLTSGDPTYVDPTGTLLSPSFVHLMGTDDLGRDVFTRVVYGARYSVIIAVVAVVLGLALAIVLGLAAAASRGIVAELLARFLDLLSALPSALMALLFATLFGKGEITLTVAIGIASVPGLARIIRREAISVRGSDYVRAAVTFGDRPLVILLRHVLPNAVAPVLLLSAIEVGTAILTVSGLSFVGLGPQAPAPEWGAQLSEGRAVLAHAWWPTFFPGLALFLTIVAFTTVGRRLQRRFAGTVAS